MIKEKNIIDIHNNIKKLEDEKEIINSKRPNLFFDFLKTAIISIIFFLIFYALSLQQYSEVYLLKDISMDSKLPHSVFFGWIFSGIAYSFLFHLSIITYIVNKNDRFKINTLLISAFSTSVFFILGYSIISLFSLLISSQFFYLFHNGSFFILFTVVSVKTFYTINEEYKNKKIKDNLKINCINIDQEIKEIKKRLFIKVNNLNSLLLFKLIVKKNNLKYLDSSVSCIGDSLILKSQYKNIEDFEMNKLLEDSNKVLTIENI